MGGGLRGHRCSTRDVLPGDYDGQCDSAECRGDAVQDHPHRAGSPAGHPTSGEPHAPQPGRSSRGPELVREDNLTDPCLSASHETNRVHSIIQQITQELQRVLSRTKPIGKAYTLAEVFCSSRSPLTQQVNALGQKAIRFGYDQGDLATVEGRVALFTQIAVHRPEHVWFSPTCGPWSSWTNLNMSRSLEHFYEYQQQREQLLYQIALGIVLCRHQISHGRHMHWEQPGRSLMLRLPCMQEIHSYTQACQFDMCRAGNLVDPVSHMPIRKSMVLLTTSRKMYHRFHGLTCLGNHEHQPIEGSVMHGQHRVLRSQYTEVYPRKFARATAQIMCHHKFERPVHWNLIWPLLNAERNSPCEPDEALVTEPKRSADKFPKSKLLTPVPLQEADPKRRRVEGKQAPVLCQELVQEVIDQVDKVLPRVGRMQITSPSLLRGISNILPDKDIVQVIACRGTDRTVGPPTELHRDEAPYRRSIMLMRNTGELKIERYWEKWNQLSQRQLVRPAHSCRINITVFARDRNPERRAGTTETPEEPSSSSTVQQVARIDSDPTVPMDDTRNQPTVQPSEVRASEPPAQFKALSSWDQNMIIRMHKNLGHPSNDRLSTALKQAGYRPELVQAASDLQCQVCQSSAIPKHQKPATLKPSMDFNSKMYIDNVTWTSQAGKSYHFYHMLDAGSNFHVAIIAPGGTTTSVVNIIQQHWMSWAGPPNEIMFDAGSEFLSTEFAEFLNKFGIKDIAVPPEAHWQNGKIERHGGFLQSMLSKVDKEHPITNYEELQMSLNQCTHAKNTLSIRHGYSPELIVFGKHSRLPGSILSDESMPSHTQALQEDENLTPQSFKKLLAIREAARRAYHVADNCNALRRAMLSRSCPSRGTYARGQHVMIWKSNIGGNPQWIGQDPIGL